MAEESSDGEYEEWSPVVLKRYDAVRGGKEYAAFLRYTLKHYDIPAEVKVVWRKGGRSYKQMWLQIHYCGVARTKEEMRDKMEEVREIYRAFPPYEIEYDYVIKYFPYRVWELCEWNGPTYFHDLMCVGNGNIPYIPRDVRALIKSF